MQYRILVDDVVSGIIGMFHHKEEAPGKERRYHIFYQPATQTGFLQKPRKLPVPIPPEGIVEVQGTHCEDGYARMYIVSYGNDDVYKPLLPMLVRQRFGDITQQLDELSIATETKSESLEARQRMLDRNREKIVQDALKLSKEVSGNKRRDRGFISMNLGDE